MRLVITCDISESDAGRFIYQYLPKVIYLYGVDMVNPSKLINIDKEFEINSFNIIKFALKNLLITRVGNQYIILFRNKLYKDVPLKKLLSLIENGNRQVKGYRIVHYIFTAISNNINIIYKRYCSGY